MNELNELPLSSEQSRKLRKLVEELFSYTYMYIRHDKFLYINPSTNEDDIKIYWLEFCLRYLCDAIAEKYAKDHPETTLNFVKYAISQKVAHEINKTHPVDLLYDMWENPKNYRVDL